MLLHADLTRILRTPSARQERIARLKAEAKQAKDAAKQRTDGENIAVLKGGSGSLEVRRLRQLRVWAA